MGRLARLVVGPIFVIAVVGLALAPELLDTEAWWAIILLPFDTVVLLSVLVGGLALGLILYVALLAREDREALQRSGPRIEAIVPVYQDAQVLDRSVEGLLAAEYEPLSITIVVEPDDGESRRRAEELAEEHDGVSVLENTERSGSKAGALNTAIETGDAPIVALFDADQRPHPKLLAHGVAALDETAIARIRSIPDPAGGILESMVYYEYLFLFFLPQKLVKVILGLSFAGTRSVLIERSVFDTVGGFREGHLAEDLDFTHRVHGAGIEIQELLYYPSVEAPAHTLRDWWGQRMRWMRGQVSVSATVLREPARVLSWTGLSSAATLVGTLVAGVLLALTVPKLLLASLENPALVGSGLVGIYLVALTTRALDDRTAGLSGFGAGWLILPVTFTLYGLVIVRILLGSGLDGGDDWYSVEKEA
ncbi:MAG: glycosyltransferase family 2 protein [Salinirussus sp.]